MTSKIISLAFGGAGIAKPNGKTVFIPFTLPGEEVTYEITKETRSYSFAKVEKILTPSLSRTTPLCKHYQVCRGCQFQHLSYGSELQVKRQFIIDAFKHIAKIDVDPEATIPSDTPYEYREHIRLNLDNASQFGYISDKKLLPIQHCPLFSIDETPYQKLSALINTLKPPGGSVRIFQKEKPLLAFSFPFLPKNHSVAKEFLQDFKGISMKSPKDFISYGEKNITYSFADLTIEFSPYGFIQNNLSQAEKLYKALINLINSDAVLELYCGVSVLSLLCARRGIDSSKENIKRAKKNASLNGLDVEFILGKAEAASLQGFDTIIVNPPREGLSSQMINRLILEKPKHILYISCMPSTLARDTAKFVAEGYRIDKCIPCDMFPQTTHVETILSLKL